MKPKENEIQMQQIIKMQDAQVYDMYYAAKWVNLIQEKEYLCDFATAQLQL